MSCNINLNLHWQLSSQIPSADVALITAGPHIKAVTNYKQVRRRSRRVVMVFRGNIITHTQSMDAWTSVIHQMMRASHIKTHVVFIGHILVCIPHNMYWVICVPSPLFWLERCPRRWKSLTWRSDHPVFWRRNFPTWLSSTLLSNHLTHNHM